MYDVVALKRDLPSKNLSAGATGTILMVYSSPNLPEAFEIEFTDEKGETLALVALEATDVEKIWPPDESDGMPETDNPGKVPGQD